MYSALDLVNFQAGQLVEAQFEDRDHLLLGEGVAALARPRLVANQDADCSTCFARPLEGEQLDLGLVAVVPNRG